MHYIVLDLEWNQPISKNRKIRNPIPFDGEIIQIGAVKMNEALEIIDFFNVMIRPEYYRKMNKTVEKLTLIKQEDIDQGMTFEDAISAFRNWCGEDCYFLAWGPNDMFILEDNLMMYGLDYSWLPDFFDVQSIFDNKVMKENRNYPLNYALYHFKIKAYAAHDALNDALNTAEVVKLLRVNDYVQEALLSWAS